MRSPLACCFCFQTGVAKVLLRPQPETGSRADVGVPTCRGAHSYSQYAREKHAKGVNPFQPIPPTCEQAVLAIRSTLPLTCTHSVTLVITTRDVVTALIALFTDQFPAVWSGPWHRFILQLICAIVACRDPSGSSALSLSAESAACASEMVNKVGRTVAGRYRPVQPLSYRCGR